MELTFDNRLGRGAFAQVWRATDTLGRDVAVKFFTDPTPSRVEQQALSHARALARVNHPAVVRVLAVEPQRHPEMNAMHIAIVMEYVPGESLSLLKKRLSWEAAEKVVRDLTAGLQAIHAADLVHGDLHDANLMIHEKGATILDILYTHSLADVGTRTAKRTLAEDLRDLAKLCRQVCERSDLDRAAVAEAFYMADTGTSAPQVTAPFLSLFGCSNIAGGSSSLSPGNAGKALELLKRIQERKELLSAIIPAVLEFALELRDAPLARLCELELTGYSAPTDEERQHEPNDEFAHRVILFHVGRGVAINPNFFSSSQAAISYMEQHPTQFYKERIMYSKALSTIEQQLDERPLQALIVMATTSEGSASDTELPATAKAYTSGNAFHTLVEGLRVRLTFHLLRIAKET